MARRWRPTTVANMREQEMKKQMIYDEIELILIATWQIIFNQHCIRFSDKTNAAGLILICNNQLSRRRGQHTESHGCLTLDIPVTLSYSVCVVCLLVDYNKRNALHPHIRDGASIRFFFAAAKWTKTKEQ